MALGSYRIRNGSSAKGRLSMDLTMETHHQNTEIIAMMKSLGLKSLLVTSIGVAFPLSTFAGTLASGSPAITANYNAS